MSGLSRPPSPTPSSRADTNLSKNRPHSTYERRRTAAWRKRAVGRIGRRLYVLRCVKAGREPHCPRIRTTRLRSPSARRVGCLRHKAHHVSRHDGRVASATTLSRFLRATQLSTDMRALLPSPWPHLSGLAAPVHRNPSLWQRVTGTAPSKLCAVCRHRHARLTLRARRDLASVDRSRQSIYFVNIGYLVPRRFAPTEHAHLQETT
ncbi:hypothetical protein DFH06DRAFT_288008 [Mycena polygramma]|nr:hypothetical protein DFH06DRAFT_288008 [Mycena polygramma]